MSGLADSALGRLIVTAFSVLLRLELTEAEMILAGLTHAAGRARSAVAGVHPHEH